MDPVLVNLPVLQGQYDLRKFGEHPKESREPHPEHRPRPSGEDSPGDTGDVASAHGAGQSSGHCLKGGEVLGILVPLLPPAKQ